MKRNCEKRIQTEKKSRTKKVLDKRDEKKGKDLEKNQMKMKGGKGGFGEGKGCQRLKPRQVDRHL